MTLLHTLLLFYNLLFRLTSKLYFTGGLQGFATETFMRMNVKQTRDPALPTPARADAQIAIVGCGPSAVSAATFLARLGYNNITCYEKETDFVGGLSSSEIPGKY